MTEKSPAPPPPPRYTEIDGIRGWAALVVVLFHFFAETFGTIEPAFLGHVGYVVFNGTLSVYIFFVLSGDALSVGFFGTNNRSLIDRLAIKRYFRLTIPIAIACLVTYALMKTGLTFNRAAAAMVQREDWLGRFVSFEPTLVDLASFAFYGVYTARPADTSYNAFMWTMPIELVGSLIVFTFLYCSDAIKHPLRVAVIATASLLVLESWYCLFFAGIVLGLVRRRLNQQYSSAISSRSWNTQGIALFAILLTLGAMYIEYGQLRDFWRFVFDAIVAMILVASFYVSVPMNAFFRCRLSQWLGSISFPLYLIHFCVLVSFTSLLIVKTPELNRKTILFIAVASVVVSLLAATLFLQLEKLLLRRIDLLTRKLLKSTPDGSG